MGTGQRRFGQTSQRQSTRPAQPEPATDRSTARAGRRDRHHADKNGKYCWYNDYRIPDNLGAGTVAVRLHANDDAKQRRFNRTENIRPLPASDPDFDGLCRCRSDAESINRALDDTLWLRRAHSIGHERQHLNLLTFALGMNSLALHCHKQRSSDPPTPLAAA